MGHVPLLLVDLDDTLVDRTAAFRGWAESFVAERGLPEGALEALVEEDRSGRRPREEFVVAVTDRLGLERPLTVGYLADYVAGFVPDVGVLDALARARAAGWTIVVVTNGGLPQLSKLAIAGLEHSVDAALVSGLEGVRKPDPRLFRLAAERAGEPLEGAWMVGDDPVADVGGAASVGIASAWLHRGRPWPSGLEPPTATVDSFADAVRLVLSNAA